MPRRATVYVGLLLFVLLVVWRAGVFGSPPITEWFFLIPAWLLGLWTAWAAHGPRSQPGVAAKLREGPPSVDPDLAVTIEDASHELEIVEGIGPGYGRRLRALGIEDTLALVERGAQASDRAKLADHLKVEPLVVQRWTSMADLLRIPGLDGQSAEVLEAAGVQTVSALADRSATNLVGNLFEVNARLRLTPGDLPAVTQVEQWIGLAGLLPGRIADL